MAALVEVEQLVKQFRRVRALDGCSFNIANPGLTGLVGKNGAGKTTLLSVLAGSMRPSSGRARVLGFEPGEPGLLGAVGVLMQDANFRRGIPGRDQLVHFARLSGATRETALAQIQSLLEELGDDEFADQPPERLSYGQRKRLGIVQALLGAPRLVLLDEPTAGLDPIAARAVRELIRRRGAETAFMLSSHNLYEIQDVCSRVIVIDRGKLVGDADISRLAASSNTLTITLDRDPGAGLIEALLQLPEITDVAPRRDGRAGVAVSFATTDVDALQMRIQALVVESGYSVVALTREKMLADDVLNLVDSH
jgi:ABC-type multidrug transport system ATPase subunit